MKKRILSIVLTLLMLVSALPLPALAAGTIQEKTVSQSTPLQEITQVSISHLSQPILGEHPAYDVTLPENAPYHLATHQELTGLGVPENEVAANSNGIWWKYNETVVMAPSDTFDDSSEQVYHTQMILIPNDGFRFADHVTATINGSAETVLRVWPVKSALSVDSSSMTASPAGLQVYPITMDHGTAYYNARPLVSAPAGTTVSIRPDAAPSGQIFDHWEVVSGEVALVNPKLDYTSFTMPAQAVHIRAVYIDAAPSQGEEIPLEFCKRTLFGAKTTFFTLHPGESIKVPSISSRNYWLGEDQLTVLRRGDHFTYDQALEMRSNLPNANMPVRFLSITKDQLPYNLNLTIRFMDGDQEVAQTVQAFPFDTQTVRAQDVTRFLPDGYLFADSQDSTVENGTVTFPVTAMTDDNCAPLRFTMKLRGLSYRLENGKRTMPITVNPGEKLVLPTAVHKRTGEEYTVRWLWEPGFEPPSGHSFTYQQLAQVLSAITPRKSDFVITGQIDND